MMAEMTRASESGSDGYRFPSSRTLRHTEAMGIAALNPSYIHGYRSGGESGIRTHGRFDPSPVFKTGALNRSAISPIALSRAV